MTIEISAFRWVPPFAQGYVRDLRVRWALEEAGFPYAATLIGPKDQSSERYRQWQPFGQVPAYKDEQVELFESGAIVLYLARQSEALAPNDEAGRARVMQWVIAALNSIEPFAQNVIRERERLPNAEAMLTKRLECLSAWLGDKDYLEGRFTAGDLIMTTVLRELVDSGVLARYPALDALRQRCEARPAFRRAFDAQMQAFRENAPA
jgi:glutathione S-transferase